MHFFRRFVSVKKQLVQVKEGKKCICTVRKPNIFFLMCTQCDGLGGINLVTVKWHLTVAVTTKATAP